MPSFNQTIKLNSMCIFLIAVFLIQDPVKSQSIKAEFEGWPTEGNEPLTVKFTDKSTGTISQWVWTFEGGVPSVAWGKGPHYVYYPSPGEYTVNLEITEDIIGGIKTDRERKINYIVVRPVLKDYGDAPDPPYPTLFSNNGARHTVNPAICLGDTVDAELGSIPDSHALGDNNDGLNDEDGLVFPNLIIGHTVMVRVTVKGSGYLRGWIDFNRNDIWDDPDERVFSGLMSPGTLYRPVPVPADAVIGYTFARFRFSQDIALMPFGAGGDGEVEDYRVLVVDASYLDRIALEALYNGTDGPNWTDDTNWLTGDFGSWYGINTNYDRVIGLDLHYNNLNGIIPPEIGYLTKVKYIDFYHNLLYGAVPPELGNLTELEHLYFRGNQLTSLPPEIGNLVSLTELELSDNQFTTLPTEIYNLANLEILNIGNNEISSLPPGISNLMNLTYLVIGSNPLNGAIPEEIGDLANLVELSMCNIQLTSIPPEIGHLTNLRYLRLGQNQLTSLSPEIINLTNLGLLNLDENQFTALPPEICSLKDLKYLLFRKNLLTSLPPEIGNLTNLCGLTLDENQFTTLPPEIGSLINLKELELEKNLLTSLPHEIGNLTNLEGLELSLNQFASLPPEIGSLTNLMGLNLTSNQLSSLPLEFSNLHQLVSLTITDNQFYELKFIPMSNLKRLRIEDNRFTFEDIESFMGLSQLRLFYSPQDSTGEEKDTTVTEGSALKLHVSVGGSANHYIWKKGHADIGAPDSDTYSISSLEASDAGSYYCEVISDLVPDLTIYCRPIHVIVQGTDVENEDPPIPVCFELAQNHPNPFNPETSIVYRLPESIHVTLKIYNIQGQEISTLVDEFETAGVKNALWKGLDSQGKKVNSGVYLYCLRAGTFSSLRKMILMQ